MLIEISPEAILIFVLILFGVALTILYFISRESKRATYRKISKLLSPAELEFFGVLKQTLGTEYYIFPKVRIADIVGNGRREGQYGYWETFAKISQKHVDFLICKKDSEPVLVVELDDASHRIPTRRERDKLVNKIFAEAGLPIVHIKARSGYSMVELRKTIGKELT